MLPFLTGTGNTDDIHYILYTLYVQLTAEWNELEMHDEERKKYEDRHDFTEISDVTLSVTRLS